MLLFLLSEVRIRKDQEDFRWALTCKNSKPWKINDIKIHPSFWPHRWVFKIRVVPSDPCPHTFLFEPGPGLTPGLIVFSQTAS